MVSRCRVLVVVVGVACMMGGCTAADEADPSGGPTLEASVSAGSASPSPTDNTTIAAGEMPQGSWVTELDPAPPLVEYGVYLDGPGMDPAVVAARTEQHDNIQNAIAECMAAQGFPYTPVAEQVDLIAMRSRFEPGLRYIRVPWLPADRESVVRVGYGVMPTATEQMAAEGFVLEDPNVTYQSSLPAAEADAYSRALYGDWDAPTPGPSCSGNALAQFPEAPVSDRQALFEAEFNALRWAASVDVVEDPRTLQLDAEWEACMKQAGWELDKLEGEHGPSLAMGRALRTRPDGSVRPFDREPVFAADVPAEERSLLGTEPEREVAIADFDCRVETNYMERITEIRVAMDEAFIAEHQEELDRLVAAAETW